MILHIIKKNQGFVKNCNYAFKITNSNYVLLLNSDCLVSKNAIEKMLNAINQDKKIGLLCPISSKSANLSYSIPSGYDYQKINKLFDNQFKGLTFDACTIVGNCLLISRDCINKVGNFDEIFEKGYSEETDYQFKAMRKGFSAKVLIDTYVFHECRVSFGEEEVQLKKRKKNLEIFFSRWKCEYDKLYKKYQKNNPISYINKHINLKKEKSVIEFKLNNKTNLETIDFINKLIIEGICVDVYSNKRNKKWEQYNTLFVPIKKNYLSFKSIRRK